MLDQKLIRENPTTVEENLSLRGKIYKISHIHELTVKKKEIDIEISSLQSESKKLSKLIGQVIGKSENNNPNALSKAIAEIIPSLKGKLEGVAMRVPTPNVSLVELVFCTKKNINKQNINKSFELASKNNLKNILEITHEKLVSIDFNHNPASAIIDGSLTSVVGDNMGKISAWYDNEWGFSNRMCDIAEFIHQNS